MSEDACIDELLHRWQVATAALAAAEARDPYSDEIDEIADEVTAARLALSQAGVRDITELTRGQHAQLIAQATVLESAR